MQLEPTQCKILQCLRMLEINHSPAPCATLMLLIVNLKLELSSNGDRPASHHDMVVYKAMPKTAKRPPARTGAPY
jgi:hypothetical protein